jgi:serine/threonine-protein kinase RIO1
MAARTLHAAGLLIFSRRYPSTSSLRLRSGNPRLRFLKTPAALQPLIDDGVIDEVLRSLKSGKEATVYLVEKEEKEE